MILKELRELIASLAYDIEFEYRGVHGSICPINHNDIALSYGNDTADWNSIDEAMNTRLFGGKCLNEIATELVMD